MFIKVLLNRMDKLICAYLGVNREVSTPHKVINQSGRLFVRQTMAYKRHSFILDWKAFCKFSKADTSSQAQEALGKAAGESIATQLTVSFKEPTIRINHV